MRKIVLNDGTEFHADAYAAGGELWVMMADPEEDMNKVMEIGKLFIDPEKTRKIESYTLGELRGTYEGYIKMGALIIDTNNMVSIRMRKE